MDGAEEELLLEAARLLAEKFRLAEEGGTVAVAPATVDPAPALFTGVWCPPLLLLLFPLPMGGLTAMAGLTAAELLSAGAAPGVEPLSFVPPIKTRLFALRGAEN